MTDRRIPNSNYVLIKKEIVQLHNKLDVLSTKVDGIGESVITLDREFKEHEEMERPIYDEMLVAMYNNSEAIHSNTEHITEVKESVSGYVELQEDLTTIVRFINKVAKVGVFFSKFALIFGVSATALNYIYDWLIKHGWGL